MLNQRLTALDNVELLSVAKLCRMPDNPYHFNKSTPKDALIEMIENYSDMGGGASLVDRALEMVAGNIVPAGPDAPMMAPTPAPTPAPAAGTDPLSMAIGAMVSTQLETTKVEMVKLLEGMRPVERVITVVKGEKRELPEGAIVHGKFEEVLQLVSLGMHVMLVGPAGSGKTHMAKMIADALGVPFSATAVTLGTTKADIFGTMLPLGEAGRFEYVQSPFMQAFENGGLHLLDEIDKFDPNMGALTNMPLSNRVATLPQRPDAPVAFSSDTFYAMSTANTFGGGTDGQFAGSIRQDVASTDRWMKVFIDYDKNTEERLINKEVLAWGRKFRELLNTNGMPRFLSTRAMIQYTAIYESDYAPFKKLSYIHGQAIAGWKPDEIAKVKGALS